MPFVPPRPDLVLRLEALHAAVDDAVRPLATRHAARLHCRLGCTQCCVDGLTVFEIEADRIRARAAEVLEEKPHPAGACAFLRASDGACRIYAHRPYVCRTQGLPLRWIDEEAEAELRDVCPLNEREDEPLEGLPAEACWTLGPVEERLGHLAAERDGGAPRRVPLRSLFAPGAPHARREAR